MKNLFLILLIMLVITACSSPLLPAPTASVTVAVSPMATENLPTPRVTVELPYPYPHPTAATPPNRPELPTTDPFATAPPQPTETPMLPDVSGIQFAKLLNAQQGWAYADGELLWTEDIGQHWQKITPVDIGEGYIKNAFFLDPQQAWVLSCDLQAAEDRDKLMHTSDGGKIWQTTEITTVQELTTNVADRCSRGYHLFFLNAQQGWIIGYETMWRTYVGEMFQTFDGGQTWQHLGTTPQGEFTFISDTEGWMLGYSFGPNPVYHTIDGGKTWQVVSVEGSDQYDDFFLPVFFDQQVGMMGVALYEEGIGDGVTFFKTQDGGTTWNPIGKLSILPASADLPIDPGDVQIWDEQTWVVSVPRYGVYWTVDGGQTWVENTTETARGIFGLTLGSATTAWGLKCEPNLGGRCLEILVVTEDMGAYWEKVEVQP